MKIDFIKNDKVAVISREDVESVVIEIAFSGGETIEQKERKGASKLLASLLTKGNEKMSAIEIAEFYKQHPEKKTGLEKLKSLVLGIKFDRDSRRRRITERLKLRLQEGMVQEVQNLLDSGTDASTLIYYGLEYKFITKHLLGELSYNEMFKGLETAIHQFSKRQMTWFRRMEKNGTKIYWLDGYLTMEEKLSRVSNILKQNA